MNNYLVTYLPTDPPTHHTYLPPYFLTYLPTYSFFHSQTVHAPHAVSSLPAWTRGHAAHGREGTPLAQQDVDAQLFRRRGREGTPLSCSEDVSEASCGTPRPCVALRFL